MSDRENSIVIRRRGLRRDIHVCPVHNQGTDESPPLFALEVEECTVLTLFLSLSRVGYHRGQTTPVRYPRGPGAHQRDQHHIRQQGPARCRVVRRRV